MSLKLNRHQTQNRAAAFARRFDHLAGAFKFYRLTIASVRDAVRCIEFGAAFDCMQLHDWFSCVAVASAFANKSRTDSVLAMTGAAHFNPMAAIMNAASEIIRNSWLRS